MGCNQVLRVHPTHLLMITRMADLVSIKFYLEAASRLSGVCEIVKKNAISSIKQASYDGICSHCSVY
jgi:hypothetical protein